MSSGLSDRRREGALWCPSISAQSVAEHLCTYANPLGPFGDAKSDAIVRDHGVAASVSLLLYWCCPSHIAGFVVAIVVDAVKGVTFFAAMLKDRYMLEKGFKRGDPFWMNPYSARAIDGVFVVPRVKTPFLHAAPCFVRRVMPHAMRTIGATSGFLVKATTGFRMIYTSQASTDNYRHVAAVATTKPHDAPVASACDGAKCDQATESLSTYINCFWPNGDILREHGNSSFLCLIQGRSRGVAWYFCVSFSCIIARLYEFLLVRWLTDEARPCPTT